MLVTNNVTWQACQQATKSTNGIESMLTHERNMSLFAEKKSAWGPKRVAECVCGAVRRGATAAAAAVGPKAVRQGARGRGRPHRLGPPLPPPWGPGWRGDRSGGDINWGGDTTTYYTKTKHFIQSPG